MLQFSPAIPAKLLPDDSVLMGTFLGNIQVIYHAKGLTELCPGNYVITQYQVDCEGVSTIINNAVIPEPWARKIRDRVVKRIDIFLQPSERNTII